MKSRANNVFFTLPNFLTLSRIILVPILLLMILKQKTLEALLILFVAGVTDLLDGFFARLWQQKTRIGALLDPLADKLLMTTCFIALSFPSLSSPNLIPLWLTATVLSRDALIIVGALVVYLATHQSKFPPSILGRTSAFCQVGTILLVLFFNYLQSSTSFINWVYYLTFAFTFLSGIHYIFIGFGMLFHPQRS
jgi:cardiolipin synthase